MLTENDILEKLDHSRDEIYSTFILLGNAYSYLIDSRLNIFRGENNKWAIAAERIGYNPRQGRISLEISYYGNCLKNLEEYNNRKSNYYHVYLIEDKSFEDATAGESVRPDAEFIIVRGQKIELSHNKSDYLNADIGLNEYEPNQILWQEAGRLLVLQHRHLFRATDDELYKSIPASLKKILVIDEWYHRDFEILPEPLVSDNKFRDWNTNQWANNRPGSYETWPLIAKVIASGDISCYKPTLKPNSHWINWKDSGSL